MYYQTISDLFKKCNQQLKEQGVFKVERPLDSPQANKVKVDGQELLMFASNNYLGLANHPAIIKAAQQALDEFGFGLSSVRFISGTTTLHLKLEQRLAEFLKTEDAILFSSCFSANEAFFAAVTAYANEQKLTSVIYSDQYNHASIIDGLRLAGKDYCTKRIYPHNDLAALEKMLTEDQLAGYGVRIIVTDGVFSMEGELADLPKLKELSDKFQCLLFVDDSHGFGAIGQTGRGSIEELGLLGKVDVISGTLSKAVGGAGGGFLAGPKEFIDFMRQKGRPYTFSNSLAPSIVAGSIKAIEILEQQPDLMEKLRQNVEYFRSKITAAGFTIIPGNHAIVPIMIGDAALTQKFSQQLMAKGLYITGLWFPVVPQGQARLRAQISAAHSQEDLDQAIKILSEVGKELGIINN